MRVLGNEAGPLPAERAFAQREHGDIGADRFSNKLFLKNEIRAIHFAMAPPIDSPQPTPAPNTSGRPVAHLAHRPYDLNASQVTKKEKMGLSYFPTGVGDNPLINLDFREESGFGLSFSPAWISFSLGLEFLQPGLEFVPGRLGIRSGRVWENLGFGLGPSARPRRPPPSAHSEIFALAASSPTMPRRKASTQATKTTPWITVTHSPNWAR